MERLALADIIEWNKTRTKPLMVYGARQVGKTYLIKDIFAERYYEGNYIYIDFKSDDSAREFVCGDGKGREATSNAKKIMEYLSLRENREINDKTLLIFDEVQEALPIVTALKYFKQDFPNVPVIVSGSMVLIKLKRQIKIANQLKKEGFFLPVGSLQELFISPMSFEEFLINRNAALYQAINDAYASKKPLDDSIHELALNELYHFLLVGGMPEDVGLFLNGASLINVRKNMVSLFDDYLNDMELYQASGESIVRSKRIFNSIYSELNRESKDFRASLIDKKLKTRDLFSPIEWLVTAGAVYKAEETKERVTIPLRSDNESNFRLYMMDNGFLAYQSGINMSTFVDHDERNSLSGVFLENYVACELSSKRFPLFYWKGKNNAEFEFLLMEGNSVTPIDVKKGRGALNSLEKFKAHNHCAKAIKFSKNNYGYDEKSGIETIPLYMVYAYLNDLRRRMV